MIESAHSPIAGQYKFHFVPATSRPDSQASL